LEPDKCDGWFWKSFCDAREIDQSSDPRLFEPIRNLIKQRSDICDALDKGLAAFTNH
jgi:hypothetical protein